MTEQEIMNKEEIIKEYLTERARKGGKALAAKMTPEERSAKAKKMVQAREAKRSRNK